MALLKDIDTDTGSLATYWRIARARYDYAGAAMVFEVEGYPTEAARRAGKTPLAVLHFDTLKATPGKPLHTITLTDMYEHMKEGYIAGMYQNCAQADAKLDGAADA